MVDILPQRIAWFVEFRVGIRQRCPFFNDIQQILFTEGGITVQELDQFQTDKNFSR
jgi:hypothetical protein